MIRLALYRYSTHSLIMLKFTLTAQKRASERLRDGRGTSAEMPDAPAFWGVYAEVVPVRVRCLRYCVSLAPGRPRGGSVFRFLGTPRQRRTDGECSDRRCTAFIECVGTTLSENTLGKERPRRNCSKDRITMATRKPQTSKRATLSRTPENSLEYGSRDVK